MSLDIAVHLIYNNTSAIVLYYNIACTYLNDMWKTMHENPPGLCHRRVFSAIIPELNPPWMFQQEFSHRKQEECEQRMEGEG